MAKVVVLDTYDWRKIAELSGGDPNLIMYDVASNELEVTDVTQAALDSALADYVANQATYDQATADSFTTTEKDTAKGSLDTRVLKAIVKGVVSEINLLRAEHSLPARTFDQVRTAIRNSIDSET